MKPSRPREERQFEQAQRGLGALRLLEDEFVMAWFSAEHERFVRDMAQAELFGDLKPKFLFGMVLKGELSERAYGLILQRQKRQGLIDDRAFDRDIEVHHAVLVRAGPGAAGQEQGQACGFE